MSKWTRVDIELPRQLQHPEGDHGSNDGVNAEEDINWRGGEGGDGEGERAVNAVTIIGAETKLVQIPYDTALHRATMGFLANPLW